MVRVSMLDAYGYYGKSGAECYERCTTIESISPYMLSSEERLGERLTKRRLPTELPIGSFVGS